MPDDFSIISNKLPEYVGIAGLPRSGKDTLAELLIEKGYYGVSLGDIIRNESRKRHANKTDPISTANMTETANWLRSLHGADFALRIALTSYEEHKASHSDVRGLVVYSVRMPIEADFLLGHGGALIWIDASDNIRYQRYILHLREGEPALEFDYLLAQEALQSKPQPGTDPNIQMNTIYIREHATHVLRNETSSVADFIDLAEKTLSL